MDSSLADFEIDGDIDLTEISNTSEHTSRFHQTHRKISKKQYRAYASKMIRSRTSFVCTFSNCSVRLGYYTSISLPVIILSLVVDNRHMHTRAIANTGRVMATNLSTNRIEWEVNERRLLPK
ncbi:hypothetical protein HZH66_013674 [Vespula vulgaris]|uniref:Uncharacterized protein n=1 Tax=Vespula vulgaris TaxID=7454 RepID=A0A834J7Y5_VESVU|nr:hypothetical protein HZH66_013674 [Vespula vulgaris]